MHKKQWQAVCGFIVDGCESVADSGRTMKDLYRIITEQKDSALFCVERNGHTIPVRRDEFHRKTVSVAKRIQENIDESHKLICLHMESGFEWAVIFWGILMSGHIPVIFDPKNELFYYRNLPNAEEAYCISREKNYPKAIEPEILLEDPIEMDAAFFDSSWTDEVVFISKDSSQKIRGIIYNGYTLSEQVLRLKRVYRYNAAMLYPPAFGRMKLLLGLPLYDFFGFVMGMLLYPLFGGEVYLKSSAENGTDILKRCKDSSVTHMCIDGKTCNYISEAISQRIKKNFPRHYKHLMGWLTGTERINDFRILSRYAAIALKIKKVILGNNLRCILSTDENMNGYVPRALSQLGIYFGKGYCNTEAGLATMELSPDPAFRSKNSVGTVLDGISARTDENGFLIFKSACFERCRLLGSKEKLADTVKIERKTSIDASKRIHIEKTSADQNESDVITDPKLIIKVRDLYAAVLNRPKEMIGENMDFFSELGGDSLTYFLLLQHIEVTFGVNILPEDRKYMITVRYAAETLKNYQITEASK
ncbi:MAG: non-ribosomal peptide synthetase [Lachnospiraceae bacterium]|nr:non-ribosomal peptide synthetase [Lachnospiraceae bacterium]